MATNLAIFNPGAMRPAFAKQGVISEAAKALAGGGNSGKRLSIKGCVFRLMVDGKEVTSIDDRYLDVVIVNAAPKVTRVFYAGTYVEGQATAPACWSPDGDKPSADVKAPQSPTCANCPKNQKGSGQGDSKACRYNQQVAVVLANDIEGEVMQLSVPARSLFGKEEGNNRPLQAYAKWLAAQHVNPEMVITRMKFDTQAESPKLYFKPMRWLTEDEYETVRTQALTQDAINAITLTVSQVDKAPEHEEEEAPPPPPKAAKANGNGKAKPAKAAPVTFCNSATSDHYLGEDLTQSPVRPAADDSLSLPSRMGQRLHYRGGLVTCMAGTPIAPAQQYAAA